MITVEKGNGGYSLTAENEEIVAIQQVDDTRFNLIGKKRVSLPCLSETKRNRN